MLDKELEKKKGLMTEREIRENLVNRKIMISEIEDINKGRLLVKRNEDKRGKIIFIRC